MDQNRVNYTQRASQKIKFLKSHTGTIYLQLSNNQQKGM